MLKEFHRRCSARPRWRTRRKEEEEEEEEGGGEGEGEEEGVADGEVDGDGDVSEVEAGTLVAVFQNILNKEIGIWLWFESISRREGKKTNSL